MSSSGTWQTTARNSSGRCSITAPTSRPPLLPPWMASRRGVVMRLRHQVLGHGDEVVEGVLALVLQRGLVPAGAELAAAADVGHHQHAAAAYQALPQPPE